MDHKRLWRWFVMFSLLAGLYFPAARALAAQPQALAAPAADATAYDLIVAMNTLRVSYGLPALVEDPILDSVAQQTAETMAAENLTWHIGNVSGRVQAAGYGGGAKVWATENFAMGFHNIDQIMQVWSDPSHMIPAVNPAYCNIGAGFATALNGTPYYVLQAAYTSAKACGQYKSVGGPTLSPGGSTTGGQPGVSQIIVPVKIASPDADGKIYHVVQAGQSFWSIAIAYKITIKDLEYWNNLSSSAPLKVGEKLFIPSSNTAGYATPTPVGMVIVSTPAPDGKIIHVVSAYQTLTTIADAYHVTVQNLLTLNGLQADWPLQIGQKLVVRPSTVTPSATPRPLTPLEKLTPASDGKYYYTVQSGQNLTYIASLYNVKVTDLAAWNNLTIASVIQPGQKLLLLVTPPPTATYTPGPPTATASPTPVTPTPTLTQTATLAAPSPTGTATDPPQTGGETSFPMLGFIAIAACGLLLIVFFTLRRR
jgi:LysM repeat protein